MTRHFQQHLIEKDQKYTIPIFDLVDVKFRFDLTVAHKYSFPFTHIFFVAVKVIIKKNLRHKKFTEVFLPDFNRIAYSQTNFSLIEIQF